MLWRKEEAEITLYNHTLYRHMTPALLRFTIVSVLPSPDCAADASSVWMTEVCLQVSSLHPTVRMPLHICRVARGRGSGDPAH